MGFQWIAGLPKLEVLDVAGCHIEPFIDPLITNPGNPSIAGSVQSLRLFAVGQDRALEGIRNAMATCAPDCYVVGGSLDIFDGYNELPPTLR
jgi:hypothetical protein